VSAADGNDDPFDTRPRPSVEVLYKQRVGSEDVYFGLGETTPSIAHCDVLTLRIALPSPLRPLALADIDLTVTDTHVRVLTPAHKLSMYLPAAVESARGSAAWDGGKATLTLTLPLVRN
jgi:hypothetical protein